MKNILLQLALMGPAGECSTPLLSRLLCCRLCLTLAAKTRHGKKWPDTHRFPPGRLARPERHGRSTCCCSGLPLLLDSIALHPRTCACLYIYGLHMSSDPTSPFYLPVSGRLAGGFAENEVLELLHTAGYEAAPQTLHMCSADGP